MNNLKLFENTKVRSVWNETEEKWYFSIQDVLLILTGSSDIKQYIKKIKSRDPELSRNWGTICTPVEMITVDGRNRKIRRDARPCVSTAMGDTTTISTKANYKILSEKKVKQIRN